MKHSVLLVLTFVLGVFAFSPAADGYFRLHVPEYCLGPEDPFCGGSNDPWRDPGVTNESWCMDCYWLQAGEGGFACGQVPVGFSGRQDCATTYSMQTGTPTSCTPTGNFCENSVVTP